MKPWRRIVPKPGEVWVSVDDDLSHGYGPCVLFVRGVWSGGRANPKHGRRGSREAWVSGIHRSADSDHDSHLKAEDLRLGWRKCTDEEAAAARRGLWPVVVDMMERRRVSGSGLDPERLEARGNDPWLRRPWRQSRYHMARRGQRRTG